MPLCSSFVFPPVGMMDGARGWTNWPEIFITNCQVVAFSSLVAAPNCKYICVHIQSMGFKLDLEFKVTIAKVYGKVQSL